MNVVIEEQEDAQSRLNVLQRELSKVIEERHVAQTFGLCYNAAELVNAGQINKCTRGCSEVGNRL